MDQQIELQQNDLTNELNGITPQKQQSSSPPTGDGVFLNANIFDVFSKISPAYLGNFLKINFAFLINTRGWKRTNRATIHKVLGYSNTRNIYYVLHKLKKCGVIKVRFMRHKGIYLKLSGSPSPSLKTNHRHIIISSGETITISARGAKCT